MQPLNRDPPLGGEASITAAQRKCNCSTGFPSSRAEDTSWVPPDLKASITAARKPCKDTRLSTNVLECRQDAGCGLIQGGGKAGLREAGRERPDAILVVAAHAPST
eukprot:scaffold96733_cov30-Tisochrysis_lutea.AAC.1